MVNKVFEPPTDAQLRELRMKHLKAHNRRQYNDLVKATGLEQDANLLIGLAKTQARDLIADGVTPEQAWKQAIEETLY